MEGRRDSCRVITLTEVDIPTKDHVWVRELAMNERINTVHMYLLGIETSKADVFRPFGKILCYCDLAAVCAVKVYPGRCETHVNQEVKK